MRVTLAGICSTDLEIVSGYAGFTGTLGHEFVGVVEEADETAWVGRRVVGSINIGCGRCGACSAGGPEHCPNRTVVGIRDHDGAFADYLTLPTTNLHAVPDSVPDEEAVFTEPLAAAVRVREQTAHLNRRSVAVLGPGRLGLLIAQVLAPTARSLTVLGRSTQSLERPRSLGLETAMASEVEAHSFDLVVEATGNPSGLEQALRLVEPRGSLVLKSTFHAPASIDLSPLVVGEVSVLGSRCGPFAPALDLLEQREVQVRPLIDAEYPLDDALAAFDHAARPGVRKVLLRP